MLYSGEMLEDKCFSDSRPQALSHTQGLVFVERSEGDGEEPGVHVAIVTRPPIWKIHYDLGLQRQHNVQHDNEC